MKYRRQSLINRRHLNPTPPQAISNFDRLIAVSTLLSNLLVGVGTITIGYVGVQLTRDASLWQISLNQKATRAQEQREQRESTNYNREQCFKHAITASERSKSQTREDASRMLGALETAFGDPCAKLGLDVIEIAAKIISQQPLYFDKQIVKASNKILQNPGASRIVVKSIVGKAIVKSEIKGLDYNIIREITDKLEGKLLTDKNISETNIDILNAFMFFGYPFSVIETQIKLSKIKNSVDIEFIVNESPRNYLEKIDI